MFKGYHFNLNNKNISHLLLNFKKEEIDFDIIKNKKYDLNIPELFNETFNLIINNKEDFITNNENYNKEIKEVNKIIINFYNNYNYKDYLNKIKWNENFTFKFEFNDSDYKYFKSPINLIFNFENNK
ncbi:hypothetical protein [Methanobrevibacter sp. AbM4]|uniref:hypothetical protein n=1 Tax=Methanobrevibacter sp. AbM4 TaxID=224719 RepID=UPI0003348E91|nr:hypothetical protein [Methanobrevibacter sp. AbM4]AGN16001.1 hypothetical protein Abm4_0078 [Methanobrevibacter sp. AbM4]